MNKYVLLSLLFIAVTSAAFAQAVSPYPCDQLSVDTILSSKLNPKQIQLNLTNHDTTLTWGPTYFCITSLAGDTIASEVLCGCVVLLRNKSGIFYMTARDSNFRVPPNFSCNLSLTGSNVVCAKQYDRSILTGLAPKSYGTPLNIFPNPARGSMTIELGSLPAPETHLTIINIQGQLLHTEILYAQETKLDLSAFSGGIYFVQVSSKGTILETKKLLLY